jgi:hypothetical protein
MTLLTMLALFAAPAPAAPADGLIWLHEHKAGRIVAYGSNGKVARTIDLPKGVPFLGLTPDGRKIVYAAKAGGRMTYHVRELGSDTGTDLGVDHGPFDRAPIWTRDGKRFIRVRGEDPKRIVGVRSSIIQYALFDLAAKKLTPLELDYTLWVIGWTPDEKGFVTKAVGEKDNGKMSIHLPGEEPTPVKLADPFHPNRVIGSPDGKTLLVPGFANRPSKRHWYHALWALDPATGLATELIHETGHGYSDACWSPDGKRLCLLWNFVKDEEASAGWDEHRLTVAKADGSERVTVTLRDKAKGEDPYGLRLLGWFPAPK